METCTEYIIDPSDLKKIKRDLWTGCQFVKNRIEKAGNDDYFEELMHCSTYSLFYICLKQDLGKTPRVKAVLVF